jgi:RecB family exonuclease
LKEGKMINDTGIPIAYIRSSSLKELESCQMSYFAKYVLGIKSPTGPAALKGTAVHKVMEVLAHLKLAQQNGVEAVFDEELNELYETNKIWDIDVVELTDKCFDHFLGHRKTTKKERAEVQEWVETVLHSKPRNVDPRNLNILAVEQKFEIPIDEPWATYDFEFQNKRYQGQIKMRGTIDLILKNDDGTIELFDWKTGKRQDWHTGEERGLEDFENDIQLQVYYYAASKMFPDLTVLQASLYYIRDGGIFSFMFGDDAIQTVTDRLRYAVTECHNMSFPIRHFSDFCYKFCHYGKCRLEPDSPHFDVGDNGKPLTICTRIANYIASGYSIGEVIQLMSEPGFKIAEYVDPGTREDT